MQASSTSCLMSIYVGGISIRSDFVNSNRLIIFAFFVFSAHSFSLLVCCPIDSILAICISNLYRMCKVLIQEIAFTVCYFEEKKLHVYVSVLCYLIFSLCKKLSRIRLQTIFSSTRFRITSKIYWNWMSDQTVNVCCIRHRPVHNLNECNVDRIFSLSNW